MRRATRRDPAAVLVGCLLALLVAYIWWQTSQLSAELRNANAARDQLASQVQELGEKPVAGPPGTRGEPGAGKVGPAGPSGPPGVAGPPGPSGSPGPAGKNGAGATGPPGAAGEDGQSLVGPAGPKGDTGPAGTDGRNGADGRDGQTCPTGYTLQTLGVDPAALVCRRAGVPPADNDSGSDTAPSLPALDPARRQYP